jgi:hypothetical protein
MPFYAASPAAPNLVRRRWITDHRVYGSGIMRSIPKAQSIDAVVSMIQHTPTATTLKQLCLVSNAMGSTFVWSPIASNDPGLAMEFGPVRMQ